jgi:hypothetical protein
MEEAQAVGAGVTGTIIVVVEEATTTGCKALQDTYDELEAGGS